MRDKYLGIPLAALMMLFTGSASAGIVGSLKSHHHSAGKSFVTSTDPTVSVKKASKTTSVVKGSHVAKGSHKLANGSIKIRKTSGFGSSTNMVLAALSTPVGHASKHHKSGKGTLLSGPSAIVGGGSPVASTPEPASASLILLGLFATGLGLTRRFQSQRS
jgi:hypothetical protein